MQDTPPAFYIDDGSGADGRRRFIPTELTRGPWDEEAQHAGPVAALLGRSIAPPDPADERIVARLTVEILRPIPIAPLVVHTERQHASSGRELLQSTLVVEEESVALAWAWRLQPQAVSTSAVSQPASGVPSPADAATPAPFPTMRHSEIGWHSALEFRVVRGGWQEPGPTTMWFRPTVPLIHESAHRPLDSVLLAADAGNGISSVLDWREYLFVNTELSVHLHRRPVGEWVCLEAETTLSGDGMGVATSQLHDEQGPIGRSSQALVILAG